LRWHGVFEYVSETICISYTLLWLHSNQEIVLQIKIVNVKVHAIKKSDPLKKPFVLIMESKDFQFSLFSMILSRPFTFKTDKRSPLRTFKCRHFALLKSIGLKRYLMFETIISHLNGNKWDKMVYLFATKCSDKWQGLDPTESGKLSSWCLKSRFSFALKPRVLFSTCRLCFFSTFSFIATSFLLTTRHVLSKIDLKMLCLYLWN